MRSENLECLLGRYERECEFRRERESFYKAFFWIVAKIFAMSSFVAFLFATVGIQLFYMWRPANLNEIHAAIEKINTAQAVFLEKAKKQEYGTLPELVESGYLNHEIQSEIWKGYRFEVQPGDNPRMAYWIKVSPLYPSGNDTCYWISSNVGVIHRSSTDFTVNTLKCWWDKGFTHIRGC